MDTVTHPTDGVVYGGRFQSLRPLKSGPGTTTLLGRDLVSGAEVVIKTASPTSVAPDARLRLEHEAQVLGDLRCPSLTPVIAVGHSDGIAYCVTPWVSGVTLRERLDRGPLALAETMTVGRTVSGALQHAHERGVLHRDIKPSNVIVDSAVPLTRATLIDFGFARSDFLNPAIRDISVGTLAYLAPEQAGLLDRPLDQRSDLYALGVLLFECIAGRVPFQADHVGDLLRHHLSTRPPELRSLGCDIPRALDDVIQRLLRKDPDDRYQTTEAVLADLTEISEALARGDADPVVVVGVHDRRQTLAEPAFVGREDDLARLDAQLAKARKGQGGVVLVEAESGGGKTRLLEEFAQRSACSGAAWVLRGQGVDQAALRPFQLLDGVVQGLLTRFEADANPVEHLRSRLGDQLEAVCEALPQLAQCLRPETSQSLGQEEHGEVRSLRALAALLDALGSQDQAALIVLDDAQWADELTLKLIQHWQRRRERSEALTTGPHVLIAAAFRTEEVAADHLLRRVPATGALALAPFTAGDLRCLAESMAGELPDEAIELLVRLADGSPFMATAVLQGLVEIGALVPNHDAHDGARWAVDRDVMAEAQSSRRAAIFLARRLDHLPAETVRLLSVGAVLGKEFDLSLAGDLADLNERAVAHGCLEARKRHLIWTQGSDAHCAFVHDKIREALLARLTDEERRALHGAAAVKIEAENKDRVFDLAYHFDAAGQSERALPYALQAAEAARSRYALAVAERQYRIAERGAGTRDRATQRQVVEGLSEVLMLRGRYEEAEEQLLKAFSLADEPLVQAQVQGKLGELAFKRGDVRTASMALETALDLLDQPLARSPVRAFSLAIWEIAVQFLHTILPRIYVARRFMAHDARRDLLVAKLYSRLAYAYWFARGAIPTLWAHLRELNLAERYPPSRELGQAYANHSAVMTMLPWFSRGIVYAKKGLAIREGIGDLWGVGQSLHFYGLLLLAAARSKDALDLLRESTRRFERTGDLWELNNALFNVAFCLYRLGDLPGAVELGRRVIQSGRDIGNIRDLAIGLEIWAKASGGKAAREAITHELKRESDDVHTVVTVMQAEAVCLLTENRPGEAYAILLDAQQRVKNIGLRNEYVAPIPVWLVTALRTDVAQRSPYDRGGFLLGRYGHLTRAVRRALRVGRRYRNSLPHALREAGLVAAMRGRLRKARKYLNQSLAVAEQQGARFEYAQTLLARGRVGLEVEWPGAASDVEEATKSLRALGAYWVLGEKGPDEATETVTPGLIDRFDTVLDVGRRIASSLSREAVHEAIREAALTLLRGEACLVLDVVVDRTTGEQRFQVVSGGRGVGQSSAPGYSQTLVDRAIETGRPVVAGDGVGLDASESVVLSGARSILCAPIAVRGGIVACFYVTHHQVGGLFGPDEERLAEFIATLAGAALENVEGLTKAETELIASSAAGLAHAIKNPVAVLRAYVQLLRTVDDRRDPAVIGRYLQTMSGALDRISELTDRLKRVPTQGCQKAPVALDRLMDRTVTEIRSLFSEARGYKVDMKIDPRTFSSIMADRDQLDLVLTNLLANACEAMPQGGLVQLSARPADGQRIAIVISDQGAGVPASIQPRLFQPFVTTKPQGTGLGLWVCKTIVEQHHGGQIAVTSEPGSGTTVVVTLPIGDVHR